MVWNWLVGFISVIIGVVLGFVIRTFMAKMQAQSIEQQANFRQNEAVRDAKSIRKEAEIQARTEILKVREKFEQEVKEQRRDLDTLRDRLTKRETALAEREANLDRKATVLDRKEQTAEQRLVSVDEKLTAIDTRTTAVEAREKEVAKALAEANARLQALAKMTRDEAKRELFARTEAEVKSELGTMIRRTREDLSQRAESEARELLVGAVQRYAASHASEMMTSLVELPGDDMKGRIIGRDGRNIRALEAATGVSFLVDETPGAVTVSSFDPLRREIARRVLEVLVQDGRVFPARIEELVEKARKDVDSLMDENGRETLRELGVQGAAPEVVRALGRLRFRTSFSQNVLTHSKEVGTLMGMLAAELGLDVGVAKRVGLFHDIGKALDQENEGTHASLGAGLLRKAGEAPEVVAGVEFHHEHLDNSVYAMLCSAADAMSSARPGARSESSEIFVNRVTKLEEIANAQPGVKKSYVFQAGRELRVVVDPETVGDEAAVVLARDISKKIESGMQYPGQIRVVVLRELRCVEYAR